MQYRFDHASRFNWSSQEMCRILRTFREEDCPVSEAQW